MRAVCGWAALRPQSRFALNNENKFGIITTMLLTMSALIAAVGAIGLAGTLSINVLERRREIGVMRAIGASSFTIAADIYRRRAAAGTDRVGDRDPVEHSRRPVVLHWSSDR